MYKVGDEIIYYGSHKPWYGRKGRVVKVRAAKVWVELEEIPGRCYVDEADLQPTLYQGCLHGFGQYAD